MARHARPRIPVDTDVWTLALQRTHRVYDRFDHVCVSFSGGKDSTATLQVALAVAEERGQLPVRAFFYDEEAIPQETEDYVRRVAADPRVDLEWYCLPVQHRNACSRQHPWWYPWAPEARDRWCRPLPPEGLTELAGFPVEPPETRLSIPDTNGLIADPRLGNVAILMGIRAAESLTRQRAIVLAPPGEENFIKTEYGRTSRGNVWKAYPIYDWTAADVWTAPARFGWDYNRAYDLMAMAGVSSTQQRCSPAFGEEPLQKLWTYAVCFPDVWNRMVDRVPGVGAAWRYSRTELYAYKGTPPKPDGMTWRGFIIGWLEKHNPEGAHKSAYQVHRRIIAHHYRTADPILADTPHPETGVSWRKLLVLAMRGDFKARKVPQPAMRGTPEYDAAWVRWRAELADLTASGRLAECTDDPPKGAYG